jgi:hypothetical protein
MAGRLETPGGSSVPVIAVVGCTSEFVARCREAARELLALVLECDVALLRSSAPTVRPVLILVKKSAYEADPDALRAAAVEASAGLVTVTDEAASRQAIAGVISKAMRDADPSRVV